MQSVERQEELKSQYPPERRLIEYRIPKQPLLKVAESSPEDSQYVPAQPPHPALSPEGTGLDRAGDVSQTEELPLVKRAHPDLGRLGAFWHTQGSGKSYSMAFFAQKVRRVVPGNFTFVVMTDREDLDDQIFRTFVGCGVADDKTPRAASGRALKSLLRENHRFVFSLVHKFNQDVKHDEPYSKRDDIIVISDEAHRTQSGKLARNMRLALPNASFIGFTGAPLFKHDHLTRRIFGSYISRYDFKRSEEDHSTVRLVYENRGEKLGIARLDLNDRIAEKTLSVDDAFKEPNHPFRVAIVCAMWLTGFDVECLSTMYIDKPMKAHTLMQAIARANRVYPSKDCGMIVDYNGMLKSLQDALAQYALGDDEGQPEPGDIVAPIEALVVALVEGLDAIESHLHSLGFDAARLRSAKGFNRISALADAVDALYTSDEAKRRFEIMAREVFARFRALLMEPSALAYAERHDNVEAIYKKLGERRDTADVTEVLKELHRIVNEAIRAAGPGEDHAEGLTVDLSQIDFQRNRW